MVEESMKSVLNISKAIGTNKYKVDLSSLNCQLLQSDQTIAFVLENVFTRGECQTLIALAEQKHFSPAPVNYGGSEVMNTNVRSGNRVIIDSEEFTSQLWTRISPFIPRKVKGGQVVGLNERLRFLKYSPEEFFAPHTDGNYVRPFNKLEMSLLTIQMYLNDDFDGGETSFLPFYKQKNLKVPIKPKTGMALVFSQDVLHEGSCVMNGVKYTVRTDVMYRYGLAEGV